VRVGAAIVVTFEGMNGPLVVDRNVLDDGTFGLDFTDDDESAFVKSAAITAENKVTVQLNEIPTGVNPKLRIAGAVSAALSGAAQGMRTPLCDSSPDRCPFSGVAIPRRPAMQEIAVTT
jgi:hypothetical protein